MLKEIIIKAVDYSEKHTVKKGIDYSENMPSYSKYIKSKHVS